MENEKNERSNIQDMVKGALIIAVIFFHSFILKDVTTYNEFHVILCLFPCVMGVFFFYAGYNYQVGKRTPGQNIVRRTKQLIIPLVVMIFVDILLVGGLQLIYKLTDLTGIWHALKQFLLSEGGIVHFHADISKTNYELSLPLAILWYLYTLYIISIIFYLIVDKVIIKLSRFIPIVVILVLLSFAIGQFIDPKLPYALQSYPLILAIMLTGAYLSQHSVLDRPLNNKKSIIIACVQMVIAESLIFGIGLLCYYAFGAATVGALPGGELNPVIKGFDAFVTYILSLFGTIFIHTLMRLITKIKIFSLFFGYLGKNVALVYVTHPIFLAYIHTLIFGRNGNVLGWFQPYAYTIITLILFIGISLLIKLIINKIKSKKNKVEEGN